MASDTKRRINRADFETLADYIQEEAKRRVRVRQKLGLTTAWADIDRQVAMRPNLTYKRNTDGSENRDKAWLPEVELPLQAQTLEVLTADARRLMFPTGGDWFTAASLTTDEYLAGMEVQSYVAGDLNDVPSRVTQDNVDKLVVGLVQHWHRQYDFPGHVDRINAEVFRYGLGCGRVRRVKKALLKDQQGQMYRKDSILPVLIPRSIKSVYPDDRAYINMQEGEMAAPLTIEVHQKSLADLKRAAAAGSSDPYNDQGGWMARGLVGVEAGKDGEITTYEAEGDFLIERKRGSSILVTNACVEVAVGTRGKGIFRLRWVDEPSYIWFPYHYEDAASVYSTGPLMKGWPVQAAATEALCRTMISAALYAQPPVTWDSSDPTLAANGGPSIYPGASIGSLGVVSALQIGNPSAISGIYQGLLMQYADVTGVNAPRLGAQTVSHTTAYAKSTELARGEVRTVDYVNATLSAALTAYLGLAYRMGRPKARNERFHVESFGGYLENISTAQLPEEVCFKAIGAGGPQEEAQKRANKLAAVQLAIQIHQLAKQMGEETGFSLPNVLTSVLREGGWTDVEALVAGDENVPDEPPPGAGIPGAVPALGATEASPDALAALGVSG